MGNVIQARFFSEDSTVGFLKPIVYCVRHKEIGVDAVSLNKLLAEELIKFKEKRRAMRLEQCFNQVMEDLPNGVIIKDFDVMFHPEYQVDVLKIMVNTCKTKPFSIIWPGTFKDNKLVYAEEEFRDYKTYDVKDYDITCIV